MKHALISCLLLSFSVLAETSQTYTVTVTEVIKYPLTVTYQAGGASASHGSSLTTYKINRNAMSVDVTVTAQYVAKVEPQDQVRLKAEYCGNEYAASDINLSPRPTGLEELKAELLKEGNVSGETVSLNVSVPVQIPYMPNRLVTTVACN